MFYAVIQIFVVEPLVEEIRTILEWNLKFEVERLKEKLEVRRLEFDIQVLVRSKVELEDK